MNTNLHPTLTLPIKFTHLENFAPTLCMLTRLASNFTFLHTITICHAAARFNWRTRSQDDLESSHAAETKGKIKTFSLSVFLILPRYLFQTFVVAS